MGRASKDVNAARKGCDALNNINGRWKKFKGCSDFDGWIMLDHDDVSKGRVVASVDGLHCMVI